MANVQLAPGKNELEQMLRRKLTQAQIVEEWENKTGVRVSRAAIAMAIKRYGLESSKPRPRYEDTLPWHVREEHRHHRHARMLRLEGRRRRGLPLSDNEKRWLKLWKKELNEVNAVVVYEPDSDQGFFAIPRLEKDGKDLIRRERIR